MLMLISSEWIWHQTVILVVKCTAKICNNIFIIQYVTVLQHLYEYIFI